MLATNASVGGSAVPAQDGNILSICGKRFRCAEVFLQPGFNGTRVSGFYDTSLQSSMKCDVHIRKRTVRHFALSGGTIVFGGGAKHPPAGYLLPTEEMSQFHLPGDGETSSDIDECDVGTDDCDTNTDCSYTAGGLLCACHTGYEEPSFQSSLVATTFSQDEKFKNSPPVSAHPS